MNSVHSPITLSEVYFSYPGRRRLSVRRGQPTWHRQKPAEILSGISLVVGAGQVSAVIGRNGCGKSTLIKVIAGVLQPSGGTRRVAGRIAALVELGAGFDPELSVHDNVLLYGSLLGNSVTDCRAAVPEILEWAELLHVEWSPVRTLSSGMVARLGFSIATHFDPDVLLIDEVMSVGDGRFQERSRSRIQRILAGGCAVVLVTHDMIAARELASSCHWMDGGSVVMSGDPVEVTTAYMMSL